MAKTEVIASTDPFDSDEYNPIDHLNALFASSSSLSSVRRVSAALRSHQDDLDRSIRLQVEHQRVSDAQSVKRIQTAQSELSALFSKISSVQTRAEETERAITDMTADIKRLDATKRNLTHSMTALKRLQMLTGAYEQLRALKTTRQYKECASLLAAVLQLMAHFKSYRSIEQIAALSKGVADIQRALLEQVCEDFEMAFAKSEIQQKKSMLSEACAVIDALGDHARQRLVNWYCNTQLREYRQVFRGSEEAGSLDNIGRRYSWFNRMLRTYDAEHATLFPPAWRVNEQLANAFCEGTREDYRGILQKQMRRTDGQPPDVNLLLSCLQETLDFEHSLEKRFASGESRTSMETVDSSQAEKPHGFSQAISEAFEPYLSIWVESQDKQLASLMPKYRQQPIRNTDEEYHAQMVIASSTELFHSYRVTLAQCAKLSTGGRLLELTKTFAKYLDAYSQQVLFHLLTEQSGPQGPSLEDSVIILNTADYCFQTTNQLEERIKSRIDEEFREQVDLQSQADAFMGICSATVRVLVRKVEIDCEAAWREMRNVAWSKLENVGDQSSYITSLIHRIRDRSKEILSVLPAEKAQYARAFCDNVVDVTASSYLTNIVLCRPISETAAEQMLLDSYALKKALLDLPNLNAADDKHPLPTRAFTTRVNTAIARLDPLLKTLQVRSNPPEGLVQAYLIHIHDRSESNFRKVLEIKGIRQRNEQSSLVELFNAHKESPAFAPNPAAASKNASASADGGLQVNNPLIGNISLSATQPASTTASDLNKALPHPFAALSSSLSTSSSPAPGATSAAAGPLSLLSRDQVASASTPVLSDLHSQQQQQQRLGISRFDPSAFGEKIMNAARDAGDRFGGAASPALGPTSISVNNNHSHHPTNTNPTVSGSTAANGISEGIQGSVNASRATSPPSAASTSSVAAEHGALSAAAAPAGLNENLKNFGKFFRRDVGSFGGFGRKAAPAAVNEATGSEDGGRGSLDRR